MGSNSGIPWYCTHDYLQIEWPILAVQKQSTTWKGTPNPTAAIISKRWYVSGEQRREDLKDQTLKLIEKRILSFEQTIQEKFDKLLSEEVFKAPDWSQVVQKEHSTVEDFQKIMKAKKTTVINHLSESEKENANEILASTLTSEMLKIGDLGAVKAIRLGNKNKWRE